MAANLTPSNSDIDAVGVSDDSAAIAEAKRRYRVADDATNRWRQEFVKLYDMKSGRQWAEEDRLVLDGQNRPAVTFNLMGKFLDAIEGLQINNRQEVRYIPRKEGESAVNELLTGAAEWVRDECDAITEESEAFADCVLGGLGAVETHIEFDLNPQGDILVDHRDPLEYFWDPAAHKRNLIDRRWQLRIMRLPFDLIQERWPEKADEIKHHDMDVGAIDDYGDNYIHHATEAWKYEHDGFNSTNVNTQIVMQHDWYKVDTMHRVTTQFGTKDVTPRQWAKLKVVLEKNKVPFRDRTIRARRYYKQIMSGGVMLESVESPYQGGMPTHFVTGKRDRNHGTWYAVGRSLREPQEWVNKFFSQILHIINVNAKGGVMAEEDAFADPQRAEQEWAKPDSITWMEEGALAQGKVMPKPVAEFPASIDRMMEFAVSAMPETSGLNMEILGMANREQSGYLEAQRKESALTVIAWAFDSMRRYYIQHGKCLAHYIREYISDGRLIRIVGKEGEQYVPLMRDELSFEFDTIVDEAPNSPNSRSRTWAILQEILPMAINAGIAPPIELLDYVPLPTDLVNAWKKQIQQQQQQSSQNPLDQAVVQEKQAKAKKDKTQADVNMAKVREIAATTGQKMAGK